MSHSEQPGFVDKVLRVVEPIVFGNRPIALLGLLLFSIFMGYQASKTFVDAGFEKQLPVEHPLYSVTGMEMFARHPYMETFQKYQTAFGGANNVLVAVINKDKTKEIYNETYLATLKGVTDDVFFLSGVDRSRVSSIFTPNVRYVEVVEGGFEGGNVIPADYAPTEEMFTKVKSNVSKASVIGRLVSNNQTGAMVMAELLSTDVLTGQKTDYVAVAHQLEDKLRNKYSLSKEKWDIKDKSGKVLDTLYHAPKTFPAEKFMYKFTDAQGNEKAELRSVSDFNVVKGTNESYNPNIDIRIVGFAKVVGDIVDAIVTVVLFFLVAFVLTVLFLWAYVGSFKLSLMPVMCTLVAVLWEFGLLHLFGYGVDPFAILVPFLVLAVGVSHGIQMINTWAGAVAEGLDRVEAAKATFRRLLIPGTAALATNVVGFGTILFLNIPTIREMAINACFGIAAIIATNKMLMPIWLSYQSFDNLEEFQQKQARRERLLTPLWHFLSNFATEKWAAPTLLIMALSLGAGLWHGFTNLKIGDIQKGVPELRPSSRYNQDNNAIVDNFALGTDILKVVVETVPDACIRQDVMFNIDQFAWRMNNTEGVSSVIALATMAKIASTAWNEGTLKWKTLPRNKDLLVQVTGAIPTDSGLINPDCSAMPVFIFAKDHKAETLESIVNGVKAYEAGIDPKELAKHHGQLPEGYKMPVGYEIGRGNPKGWHAPELPEKPDVKFPMPAERPRNLAEAEKWDKANPDWKADFTKYEKEYNAISDKRKAWTAPTESDKEFSKGPMVRFSLATGNAGVMAAQNEVVHHLEQPILWFVLAAIFLCCLVSFQNIWGTLCVMLPLTYVSYMSYSIMVILEIGLKVSTLPVAAFAAGVGVDYGIYIFSVMAVHLSNGRDMKDSYFTALTQTGKAVVFTGFTLAMGVGTWLASELQFQVDMGKLLMFMFLFNMVAAVTLLPAMSVFLLKGKKINVALAH